MCNLSATLGANLLRHKCSDWGVPEVSFSKLYLKALMAVSLRPSACEWVRATALSKVGAAEAAHGCRMQSAHRSNDDRRSVRRVWACTCIFFSYGSNCDIFPLLRQLFTMPMHLQAPAASLREGGEQRLSTGERV